MADGSGPINDACAANLAGLGVDTRRKRVVVGFAGGGGSSQAVELALGIHPDAALNHWPTAISVHEANYPDAEHHCADIMDTDPRTVLPGEDIGLLWLSPDCRHFSKAKGGAPVSKRVRGLAWAAIPWIKLRRPDVVMIENVEEFITWSPLIERLNPKSGEPELYPDPARKGETFRRWTRRFEKAGYVWEVRPRSKIAEFGDPTIRVRLMFIARRDGKPIVWPQATHGPRDSEAVKSGRLEPYGSAASIIDWSRECPSIFLTPEGARARRVKRPLKPATLKRIAKGLLRYTIGNSRPFIVNVTHQGGERARSVDEGVATITGAHRGELALVAPNMVRTDMSGAKYAGQNSAEDPLRTITSAGGLAVTQAALIPALPPGEPGCLSAVAPVITGCGGRMGQTEPVDPEAPYPTITAKNDSCLAAAVLVPRYSERDGQAPRAASVEEPLATVVATNNQGAPVVASLAPVSVGVAHGEFSDRPGLRAWPVEDPARVVTGSPDQAVAAAYVTKFSENSVGHDPAEPLHTVMAGAPRHGLVTAYLGRQFGKSVGSAAADPVGTVTAGGGGKTQVVTAFMEQANTGMVGHDARSPLSTIVGRGTTQRVIAAQLTHAYTSNTAGGEGSPEKPIKTVTAGGNHAYVVESEIVAPSLHSYYGTQNVSGLEQPTPTVTTRDRFGLVHAHLARCGSPRPAAVAAFLAEHYGELTEADIADPLGSITSRSRWGIVMVPQTPGLSPGEPGYLSPEPWQIVDIGMRMLDPATELAAAMGFRPDYILTRDAAGRPITKTDVTKMVGNAVCRRWAAAHIKANCDFLREGADA